jgi:hypothetical protein
MGRREQQQLGAHGGVCAGGDLAAVMVASRQTV